MQNIIKNNGIDMVYAILVNRKNPYNAKDYEKFKYINIKVQATVKLLLKILHINIF